MWRAVGLRICHDDIFALFRIIRRPIGGFLLSAIWLPYFCLAPVVARAGAELLPSTQLSTGEVAAIDKMALPAPKPWTGDFDGMRKRRLIRILVVHSKTLYFFNGGQELGIDKEYANAFEAALNKKYKTRSLKIHVAMIPVTRDKLLSSLNEGLGDIAAGALTITPERQALVDFVAPIASGVREAVITGPTAPELKSIDDLAGKTILVRKSSSYYTHLLALNDTLKSRNLTPVILEPAAEDLEDEDLMEMVNAGLLPFVVVDRYKGKFWEQVLKSIKVRDDLLINEGGDIAWAVRKDSPLLKLEIDDFMKSHKIGTTFGNTVLQKYLKNTKLLKNAYSDAEMAKFRKLVGFFRKYASQYKFNDLMLIAQGYQESQLDQSRKSKRGAVGVMQLLPSTAADPVIGIKGIDKDAEKNIQAGIKYMSILRDRYLNDPQVSDKDRTLMTFAAYNAGPGNLNKFRRLAAKSNLDPNVWFNNVEIAASRIVGSETVQYVSNIYKYYIAYELVKERQEEKAGHKKGLETSSSNGTAP